MILKDLYKTLAKDQVISLFELGETVSINNKDTNNRKGRPLLFIGDIISSKDNMLYAERKIDHISLEMYDFNPELWVVLKDD